MPAAAKPIGFLRLIALVVAMFAARCGVRGEVFTVTNANDSGAGSLREAMIGANTNGTIGDFIQFNIPGGGPFQIVPASPLPYLTEPVAIDATTQPGFVDRPRVELVGTSAGANEPGFYLLTSNCVIRGFAINRFGGDGIRIENFGGHVIQANFIGTDAAGTNAAGNGVGGITLLTAGNLIGGSHPTNRNVISGNTFGGINLLNSGASGNVVAGNYIGTDFSGTKRLGNLGSGVLISGGISNTVGGVSAAERNIISGNFDSGIYLYNSARDNFIAGNYIGPDATGLVALTNSDDGVIVVLAMNNTIGGVSGGAGNVISGNGGRGVFIAGLSSSSNVIQGNFIGTTAGGMQRLANQFHGVDISSASSNLIGGMVTGAGNTISGNALCGVRIGDGRASYNSVQGNLIGVDATGTNGLGNLLHGVFVMGVSNNLVGGNLAGAGNVISANLQNGVFITFTNTSIGFGNVVQGNLIGTDATGTKRIGNVLSGVRVETHRNVVGGLDALARNIISGNSNNGALHLFGNKASNNIVQGNYIGTDITGMTALPNSSIGVWITNAPVNQIGGAAAGARNVISGNLRNGVMISGALAFSNVVQGNFIGTDASGLVAVPNGSGLTNVSPPILFDTGGGIDIAGAAFTQIGGSIVGAGNLISGNWRDGIAIGDAGSTNTTIQGNLIGTKTDGVSPLGNEWHGIEFRSSGGAGNAVVGGSTPVAFNVIAYAQLGDRDGVRIRPAMGNTNIFIHGNMIFSNGTAPQGLGIDLGANNAVDANDNCDGDNGSLGANLLQNYPVLTAAFTGAGTTVQGNLNSTPSATYRIQFYSNDAPDTSGYGEGQQYLGEAFVNTGVNCTSTVFTVTLPQAVSVGRYIVATATDAANNTSEFSATVPVVAQPQLAVASSGSGAPVVVSWPSNAFPFALQQATNLTPPVLWLPVTNVPVLLSGTYSVELVSSMGNRFYRLSLP